jgi:hypothetical protein
MKAILLLPLFFAAVASADPIYVCTARSLAGRPYRATGPNRQLTMLSAITECEKHHLRCYKSGCVLARVSEEDWYGACDCDCGMSDCDCDSCCDSCGGAE